MKFHCDRCKTRYSIGDERVRGKILKIRCKNCSAVITVREQKDEDSADSLLAKSPTKREPEAEPRRSSSSDASPAPKEIAAPKSALRGAFHQVFDRPVDDTDDPSPSPSDSFRAAPPDHFEQEWYVAIDGDQSGPFPLEEAKEWVAERPTDEEIFCWNEDFDDWLPVEKVSHFRGIRARAASADGRAPSADGRAPSADGRAPSADGPAPSPSRRAESPEPLAPIPTGPSTPASGAASSVAAQARSALEAAAASGDSGVLGGRDILTQETPKPLFAPTFAALEAEQKPAKLAIPDPAAAEEDFGDTVQEPSFSDVLPQADVGVAGAAPAQAGGAGVVQAEVPPSITPSQLAAKGGDPLSAPDDLMRAESDFDLDIGEASRVVKVPVLAEAAGVPKRGDAGLPGVARIRPGSSVGIGAGQDSAIPALSPLSDHALADARPDVLAAGGKRRANLVVPIVAGVAVVAVVLGVFISLLREGEDDGPLARSKLAGDELASRTEGPERIRVVTKEVEKKDRDRTRRTPRDKGRSNPSNGNGNSSSAATNDTQPVDNSLRPLTPSDVIRASRENGLGNKRCYERALKKDPFLDVKKIKVTLSVGASGVVTALKMDSYANTFLGQCLASRIRKWPFRKSGKGITTELTLSFEQM